MNHSFPEKNAGEMCGSLLAHLILDVNYTSKFIEQDDEKLALVRAPTNHPEIIAQFDDDFAITRARGR